MSFKLQESRSSKVAYLDDGQTLRRGSTASIELLEELITCSIHLGLLDNPHQLPCGHAFCLECLDRCLVTNQDDVFSCPLCRANCPVPTNGANGWPIAFTHNPIIHYVIDQRLKRYKRTGQDVSPTQSAGSTPPVQRRKSLLFKAELLKKLAQDLASKHSETGPTDRTIIISELNALLSKLQDTPTSINSSEAESATVDPLRKRSSYDVHCDVENTRQVMRRSCEYKVHSERQIHRGESGSCSFLRPEIGAAGYPCADIDWDAFTRCHVYADSSGTIVIFSAANNSVNKFRPRLSAGEFQPLYLRLFQNSLYASGLVQKTEDIQVGILIRCNLEGDVIAASSEYVRDSPEYPPLLGFDIHADTCEVYVTRPSRNLIIVLNHNLTETYRQWEFLQPPLHPCYLCYNPSEQEFWATCPHQGTILILNEASGKYHHFGTDQIFSSVPSHIICTSGQRVCFLDDKMSRVFWIKRRHYYLCIQRLTFGHLRRTPIRLLQPLPGDRLLLANDKSLYIAKPSSSLSRKSACTIL